MRVLRMRAQCDSLCPATAKAVVDAVLWHVRSISLYVVHECVAHASSCDSLCPICFGGSGRRCSVSVCSIHPSSACGLRIQYELASSFECLSWVRRLPCHICFSIGVYYGCNLYRMI